MNYNTRALLVTGVLFASWLLFLFSAPLDFVTTVVAAAGGWQSATWIWNIGHKLAGNKHG